MARLRGELTRKDENDAPVYRDPSATELASILSDLGLAAEGAAPHITAEDVGYRLTFSKPAYGAEEALPDVEMSLDLGEDDGLDLTLDENVVLTLASAEASFDLTFGVKIKDPEELAAEFGLDLRDSDGDGDGLVDPCGFDSQPCNLAGNVDLDADGDGLIDAIDDNDDDADRIPEVGAMTEDFTCDILSKFVGATCEELARMNNVADAAAFDALPIGTVLKLDAEFRLPSPVTTEQRVFVQPGEELVTLSSHITGSIGDDADPDSVGDWQAGRPLQRG